MLWLIVGLVLGGAVIGLMAWMRSKNTSLTWYEWLLGILGVLLLILAIQNFTQSLWEIEAMAGWMMMLYFGLPGIIILAVTARLVSKRSKAA